MNEMTSEQVIELGLTSIFVLIAGMVLWRLGGLLRKGKKEPKGSTFFKNNMKERQKKL
ncbi:MAG: hypothetical protein H6598_07635 [Flavobacteriales bacterium]|nr:hypothetical protein [Flavobacteriales bacterium]